MEKITLIKLRKQLGYNQREFAAELNTDHSCISRYERNIEPIPKRIIKLIREKYDYDITLEHAVNNETKKLKLKNNNILKELNVYKKKYNTLLKKHNKLIKDIKKIKLD